jgi:hypothetical protein
VAPAELANLLVVKGGHARRSRHLCFDREQARRFACAFACKERPARRGRDGRFAAQGVVCRAHLRPLPTAQSGHAGREPLPGAQTQTRFDSATVIRPPARLASLRCGRISARATGAPQRLHPAAGLCRGFGAARRTRPAMAPPHRHNSSLGIRRLMRTSAVRQELEVEM